jgi:hypothetical protein
MIIGSKVFDFLCFKIHNKSITHKSNTYFMSQLGHIFIPQDDSLEARIEAFRVVRNSSDQLNENSKKLSGWGDMLGSDEEIKQAKEIMQNSLTEAAKSIHQDELVVSQEKGLLENNEIEEIALVKRKVLMDELREKQDLKVELVNSLKR